LCSETQFTNINLQRNSELCAVSSCVLFRRDSEFGLLRDIEKRTQILVRSLEGSWGPAPRPPGFIALGHQQVLRNGLAGFERTEAGVAAEGSHCAGWSPAQWGSENLSTASLRRSGCFPAEPWSPERHWRIRQGQAVVALSHASGCDGVCCFGSQLQGVRLSGSHALTCQSTACKCGCGHVRLKQTGGDRCGHCSREHGCVVVLVNQPLLKPAICRQTARLLTLKATCDAAVGARVSGKWRVDRADGREWDGWGPAVPDGPVRPPTTSTFYSLPSALYFWPKAKNRGDKTPLELFLAGLRGWEPGIRRYFPEESGGAS
jgi:hypothetical protein